MDAWLDQVLTSQAGVIHSLLVYAANGAFAGGRSLYVANGAWVQAGCTISNTDAVMAIAAGNHEGTKLIVNDSPLIFISGDDEYDINGTVCLKIQYKGKADNTHPELTAGAATIVTPNKNIVVLCYGAEYAQKVPHIAIDTIAKYMIDNGY